MMTKEELLPEIDIANAYGANQWKIKRLRFCLKDGYNGLKIGPFGSQIKMNDIDRGNGDYKIYGQENIIAKDFKKGNRFLSKQKFEELKVYEIKPGDILITMMGTTGECLIAPVGIQEGIMDSHLIRLRTKEYEILADYLQLLISSVKYIKYQVGVLGKGSIMHGLNSSVIKSLNIIIPDIQYQKRILSWVVQRIGKLDRLIAKKEELLKLLAEKRTALITQAVTKGLDPNVEMKDSGIDWLGEIPKHWEISKIGYDYDVQLGKMIQPEPKNESDEFLPYLRSANIQWMKPDMSSVKSMWFSPKDKEKYNLIKGDLLISEGGDVGRSCIWNHDLEMYFQNAINRVRSIGKSNIEFLYYWMFFLKNCGYINIICNSSTIAHFTAEKVKATPFFRPKLSEQVKIIDIIKKQTERIDRVTDSIVESVVKLKEYREALITAAVTGQIDVREEMVDVEL